MCVVQVSVYSLISLMFSPGGLFPAFHAASGLFTELVPEGRAYSWANPFSSLSGPWSIQIQAASQPQIDHRYYTEKQRSFCWLIVTLSLSQKCSFLSLIIIHPVPGLPPSLRRGPEERCCLHRLAWEGNAMHLKADRDGEEEEEEEKGSWGREGGGGQEWERRRRMRW